MIVDQIDIDDIRVLEAKDYPPVSGNRHTSIASQIACERMQAQAREIHILWRLRRIEVGKNARDLLPKGGVDLRRVIALIQAL